MAASDDEMGFPEAKQMHVRAWFLGERIDLRAFSSFFVRFSPQLGQRAEVGFHHTPR
jgi:hypothetical protein